MVKVRVGVLSVVQLPSTRVAGPREARVGVELGGVKFQLRL